MKRIIIIIISGLCISTLSSAGGTNAVENVVDELGTIGLFEHLEDIEAHIAGLAAKSGLSSNEFSSAIVKFAQKNEGCSDENQKLCFIRAVAALEDYGTTNAVDYLEHVLANGSQYVCSESMSAYMRISNIGRKLAFLDKQRALGKDFGESSMRVVYGRLASDVKKSVSKSDREAIVSFLSRQPAKAGVDDDILKRALKGVRLIEIDGSDENLRP